MFIPKKILFTGLGTVGQLVLDALLRSHLPHRVLVGGRSVERISERVNLSLLTAAHLGFEPDVRCVELDLLDIDRTAELLATFRPDIVFNCATLQSWWVIRQLPAALFEALDRSQVGPWLPLHLTLIHKLMLARQRAASTAIVVNTAFPDATHPILASHGLSPTTGIGNVANCVPPLRAAVALALGVPLGRVAVRLIAQHYVSHRLPRKGHPAGAPLRFAAYVDGADVTSELDHEMLFGLLPTRLRRVGGRDGSLMTATSALVVLQAIADDATVSAHAPGPNGLPGGYPVKFVRGRIELDLPPAVSLDEAIAVNREGLRHDGIEDILGDGTVVFREPEMAILAQMLGYHRERMALHETEACAVELLAAYRAFAVRSVGAAA